MPPFNRDVCLTLILSDCLQAVSPWIKHLQTHLCRLEAGVSQGNWEDRWAVGQREGEKKREEKREREKPKREADTEKNGERYPLTEKSRMGQKKPETERTERCPERDK